MKEKSNRGIIIVLIGIIIVILVILCVLFATNVISLNINNQPKSKENNDVINTKENIDNTVDNENSYNREDIILKLKEALSDNEWVKNNLYSKQDCFGNEVNSENQDLYFLTLYDEENNPIVIVLNSTYDNFISICYKVYFYNGDVVAKNITGSIGHPGHGGFSVDEKQGLVIYNFAHMGNYKFTAYDIKNEEIKIYDEYTCDTGNCDYEYKGNKKYDNFSPISTELTNDNINNYLK